MTHTNTNSTTMKFNLSPLKDRTQAAKDLLAAGWSIDEVIGVLGGAPAAPPPYYPPLQPYIHPNGDPYPNPPFIWSSGGTTFTLSAGGN